MTPVSESGGPGHPAGVLPRASGAILVTGMPRSGTTWLARLFALAPGAALAGREPMNPRGRQYALGGTVGGWVRLTEPTARQQRLLKRSHRGLTPMVYSRYGLRQWAAPLPGTRLVVKDPFAMLSIPATLAATGSRAVLVYRHPGAMLASYRRMGWLPDIEELAPVARAYERDRDMSDPSVPPPTGLDPSSPEAMGWFWNALYSMALADLARTPETVVVAHEDVAAGGEGLARSLTHSLGLEWGDAARAEVQREASASASDTAADSTALHVFDRSPSEVAQSWRRQVSVEDVRAIESVTETMRSRLHQRRLVV